MNNLQQVIDRAKADIAKKYVFVHMPIPQLETLLNGLEELQTKIDKQHDEFYNEVRIALQETEFWKKAAETQKENNIAILKEYTAMKEALKWYGDELNYTVLPGAQLTGTDKDMGYRAKKALSTLQCTD